MTQSLDSRYLPNGGVWQRRGGIARHGAVASQSDKGEIVFDSGLDRIPSYGQRGSPPMNELVVSGLLDMFPAFGQVKLMRQWGGIVDVVPDPSPSLAQRQRKESFSIAAGPPAASRPFPPAARCAHLLATGEHHEISRRFDLSRFPAGRLIDEAAGSGIAH
jgi:sarcosine oxidase, subunit beta